MDLSDVLKEYFDFDPGYSVGSEKAIDIGNTVIASNTYYCMPDDTSTELPVVQLYLQIGYVILLDLKYLSAENSRTFLRSLAHNEQCVYLKLNGNLFLLQEEQYKYE